MKASDACFICLETVRTKNTGNPFFQRADLLHCALSSKIPPSRTTCDDHRICSRCLVDGVKDCVNENRPVLYCCDKEAPLDLNHRMYSQYFDHLLLYQYSFRLEELSTPGDRRTYCSSNNCRKFVSPKFIIQRSSGFAVECPYCATITCTVCKQTMAANQGAPVHECTARDEDSTFTTTAKSTGIKRCPGCGIWIQLVEACNHVECYLCKAAFCFVCLRDWTKVKRHKCPWFGEPRGGYDDEGYEIERGIHWHTGLDREGYDVQGFNIYGLSRKGKKERFAWNLARGLGGQHVHQEDVLMEDELSDGEQDAVNVNNEQTETLDDDNDIDVDDAGLAALQSPARDATRDTDMEDTNTDPDEPQPVKDLRSITELFTERPMPIDVPLTSIDSLERFMSERLVLIFDAMDDIDHDFSRILQHAERRFATHELEDIRQTYQGNSDWLHMEVHWLMQATELLYDFYTRKEPFDGAV